MISKERIQNAIQFIKEHLHYLQEEDLDGLYALHNKNEQDFTCVLTQALLDCGIKPWNYLTTTYLYMYTNVEHMGVVDLSMLNDDPDIIVANCFRECPSVTEVIIPNNVFKIEEYAFKGCKNLQKVVIGSGIQEIQIAAFHECTGLKEVYIQDLSAWLNIDFESPQANPLYHGAHLYINGQEITELKIPPVKSFAIEAFVGANWITSVYIPKQLIVLHLLTFTRCQRLTDIYYEGTKDEWLKMTLGNQDKDDFKNKIIIHCADGSFEL